MEESYPYSAEDIDRFMEAALKLVHEAGDIITKAMKKMNPRSIYFTSL